jgi:predicted nucleic acid-binding Zn ribbon protein
MKKHCLNCKYSITTENQPCGECGRDYAKWKPQINLWMILCLILFVLLFVEASSFITDLQDQDKIIAQLQAEPQATVGKYTMITNLSSAMYINSVIIPKDALRWTDVNGVSGFDVTIGTTHYRYVEGHIEPLQLNLYAPYLYIEENIFE